MGTRTWERTSIYKGYNTEEYRKIYLKHRDSPNTVDAFLIHDEVVSFGPKGSRYLAKHIMANNPQRSPANQIQPQQQQPQHTHSDAQDHQHQQQQQSHLLAPQQPQQHNPNNKKEHSNGNMITWNKHPKSPFLIFEVTPEQARVVPLLLDFMYSCDDEDRHISDGNEGEQRENEEEVSKFIMTEETNQTLCAMYELSKDWDIPAFQLEAAKIQQKRLCRENLLDILTFASQYENENHSDPLLEVTLEWCAEHIHEFRMTSSRELVVAKMEPVHLLQILKKNRNLGAHLRIDDFARSSLVARYIEKNLNRDMFTQELLNALTDEELLPFIGPRLEAPIFLTAQSRLLQQQEDSLGRKDVDARDCPVRELSSLEERCIQSITTYWQSCYLGFCRDSSSSYISRSETSLLSSVSSPLSLCSSSSVCLSVDGNPFLQPHEKDGEEAFLDFLHELPLTVLEEMLERSSSVSNTATDENANHGNLPKSPSRPKRRVVMSSRATVAEMLFKTIQPLIQRGNSVDSTVFETDDDESSCRTGLDHDNDSLMGLIGNINAVDINYSDDSEGDDEGSVASLSEAANRLLNQTSTDLDPFFVELYYDTMSLTATQVWI